MGNVRNNNPSLIEAIAGGGKLLGSDRWEEAMDWHRSLAVLFVIFALAGCVQGATGQAQAPHSPRNNENTQDRGSGY